MRVVLDFVERRRLHRGGVPVSLDAVEDVYPPMTVDFQDSGVAALGLPPLGGGEARPDHPGAVALDAGLTDDQRRLAYAHEVGHLLLGHVGSLALKEISAPWHEKQEAEAWAAAAALLIPESLYLSGATCAEIAAEAGCPEGLAARHPALEGMRAWGLKVMGWALVAGAAAAAFG